MNDQKHKRDQKQGSEESYSNVTLTQVDSAPPIAPGETPQKREAVLKASEPSVQIVQERMKSVVPRTTVTRFRCSGQWWSAIRGKEMKVPVAVADHMEEKGML